MIQCQQQFKTLFRRKEIEDIVREAGEQHGLRKILGATQLVALGIGAIIGAGIFVMTGQAAAQYAGPAIIFSFMLSGLGCLMSALCYAELAAMIPVAGSAYTYAYATLGEFPAWIIGWDLILEYLFSAPTVAVGWSGHVVELLNQLGFSIGPLLTAAPIELTEQGFQLSGSIINVPAMVIIVAITALLVFGVQESGIANLIMVIIKVSVLLTIIAFGFVWIFGNWQQAVTNWTPFLPPNTGTFGQFGWSGVLKAAAVIFFAYIGFDAVSCSAQEAKNPQRDMPRGILLSLFICTTLFVLFCLVLTGMLKYTQLNSPAPVIAALTEANSPFILLFLVSIAALAGLTSVILVMLMGQPRIFMSMAKDGLLPDIFARLHPKFRTPYITQILTGVVATLIAGLFPLSLLGELVSIGTLLAFTIVAVAVLLLRHTQPDFPRPFRTPLVPLVPGLGAFICLSQMLALPWGTWLRLVVWLVIGCLIYFFYGRPRSRLLLANQSLPTERTLLPTEEDDDCSVDHQSHYDHPEHHQSHHHDEYSSPFVERTPIDEKDESHV